MKTKTEIDVSEGFEGKLAGLLKKSGQFYRAWWDSVSFLVRRAEERGLPPRTIASLSSLVRSLSEPPEISASDIAKCEERLLPIGKRSVLPRPRVRLEERKFRREIAKAVRTAKALGLLK